MNRPGRTPTTCVGGSARQRSPSALVVEIRRCGGRPQMVSGPSPRRIGVMGLRRLSVGGGWEPPHLALSSFSGAVERNEPRGEPLEAINRSAGEHNRRRGHRVMRRRDFAFALLLASTVGTGRAQERAKQHRVAIVVPGGQVTRIGDPENRFWPAFFKKLSQLGDVEGQNLTIERYSGEGRPEDFADLTRRVVDSNPDLIVAITNQVALAARTATGTIPIVWTGVEPVRAGLARSLAHPGGNITGITIDTGNEIWGKRLQILKEVVPSASKIAFLGMRVVREGPVTQQFRQQLNELGQQLEISAVPMMLLRESTPAELQRVFHEIAADRPDAIIVSDIPDLSAHSHLILEFVDRSRLPVMYPYRNYVEAGGLMAYASDLPELARRLADDVHQILNGAKPGDIPIYQPTKFEFLVNLKAAKTLGLTVPPSILARADEVIE